MAHAGRLYKVQFRRDLALDTDNNHSYPEAFKSTLRGLGGPVGTLMNNVVWQSINLLTDSQPPMVWSGVPQIIAGTAFRLNITVFNPGRLAERSIKYRLEQAASGNVTIEFTCPAGTIGGNFAEPFGFNTGPFTLGFGVTVPGGVVPFVSEKMVWSEYNP